MRLSPRPLAAFGLLVCLLTACAGSRQAGATDATPSTPPPTATKEMTMKQFVMIFRQSDRVLTDQEIKQRADEIRVWAQTVNAQGGHLDPRILADDTYAWSGPGHGSSGQAAAGQAGTLTALLFLEAPSFADAVRVSGGHPGLRYGSTVEVRPWTQPARPQPVAP